MRKHLLAVIALAFATTLLFSGCSSKTDDEQFQELREKVHAALEAKDSKTALKALSKALNKKAFEAQITAIHCKILEIYLLDEQIGDYMTHTAKVIRNLKDENRVNISNYSFFNMLNSSTTENTEKLLTAMQQAAAGSQPIMDQTEIYKVHLLAKKKMWPEVEKEFKTLSLKQNDSSLYDILRRVTAVAKADKQIEVSDKIAEYVLDNHANRTRSISLAAGTWINTPLSKNDLATAQQRLDLLLEKNLPLNILVQQYSRNFHKIMGSEDKTILKNMATSLHKLNTLDSEGKYKDNLKLNMLDASFLTHNYAASLELITSGIPGRDEDWHKLASAKLKAHLALKEDKKTEAVKHFRNFMEIFKEVGETEADPTTQIRHTVNMTLAFNAKRIGKLLAETNDTEGSKKAYEEAKGYYKIALEETADMPKSLALVKEQMTELINE